jgi:hypothetical protein
LLKMAKQREFSEIANSSDVPNSHNAPKQWSRSLQRMT